MAMILKLWSTLIFLSFQFSVVSADLGTKGFHPPMTSTSEAEGNSIPSLQKSIRTFHKEGAKVGQREKIENQSETTGALNISPLMKTVRGKSAESSNPRFDRIGDVGSSFQTRVTQKISFPLRNHMLTVDAQGKTGLDNNISDDHAPIEFTRGEEKSNARPVDVATAESEINDNYDADEAHEENNDVKNKVLLVGGGEKMADTGEQGMNLEGLGAAGYDGRIDASSTYPDLKGSSGSIDSMNQEEINKAIADSITNDESPVGVTKSTLDSIESNRAYSQFGKKNSDISDFEKRRFDPIGNSAFSNFGKRRLDSIGDSAFSSFGKRRFDPIGNSAFANFGKRRFDPIGNSAFSSFGKRRFDPIGDSAFANFGKRRFDPIGDSAFANFGKRRFDPIGNSAFSNFGKRRFDPIGDSAFANFGKRRFDPIGNSAFSSFGKRRFDPIGNSAFANFGKRRFDPIGDSAFANFGKRRFDPIGDSAFSSFGKRRFDPIGDSAFANFGKRRFDPISDSAFANFGKRRFDPISDSAFANFGKRRFDPISDSAFANFGKRRFDSISDGSQFAVFGKKDTYSQDSLIKDVSDSTLKDDTNNGKESVNGISESASSSFRKNNVSTLSRKRRDAEIIEDITQDKKPEINKRDIDLNDPFHDGNVNLEKRAFGDIDTKSLFRRFDGAQEKDGFEDDQSLASKRRFDSIGSKSTFGLFGKRGHIDVADEHELIESLKSIFNSKRRFDSIGSSSGFRYFGKRPSDTVSNNALHGSLAKRRFDKIGYSSFASFGKKRSDSTSGASDFGTFGKRRFDRIAHYSPFTGFGKRRLDSTEGDQYPSFGKRFNSQDTKSNNPSTDIEIMDLLSLLSDLSPAELKSLGLILDRNDNQFAKQPPNSKSPLSDSIAKRRFDSIDGRSAFRRFGRYTGGPSSRFSLVPDFNTNYPTSSTVDTSDDLVELLSRLHRFLMSLDKAANKQA